MTESQFGRDPMFDRGVPVTPYGDTTAWSGSTTSRARAEGEDASGATTYRQARILDHLDIVGPVGLTAKELGTRLGVHHGQASGALSSLHKAEMITRLATEDEHGSPIPNTVRDGYSIYVSLENVQGRPTVRQGRTKPGAAERDLAEANGEVDRLCLALAESQTQYREMADRVALLEAEIDIKAERITGLQSMADERQQIINVLRTRQALALMDVEEQALHDLVGQRLATKADAPDDEPIRVFLSTLRRLHRTAARLRRYEVRSGSADTPAPDPGGTDGESPRS